MKKTTAFSLSSLLLLGSIWLGDLAPGAVREVADFGVEYDPNN